jgi:hypothetical protein
MIPLEHKVTARSSGTRLPVVRSLRFPFVVSLIISALLVLISIAGLLYGQHGLYRPDPRTLPTFLAQDALTLFVGLPLLLIALWQARRGSLRALLLWMAVLFYFAYSYSYYLLSPEFNVLYLGYIAIVSMSGYSLLYLLLSADAVVIKRRFSPATPVRLAGGFLAFMSVLMGMKWVTAILSSLTGGPPPTQVDLGVYPMDLAIAFPAMFLGGVWLWRRDPLGFVVGTLLLVKAAGVGVGLVLATWLVTLWGVPADPTLPVYALVGVGGAGLATLFLRSIEPPNTAADEVPALAVGSIPRGTAFARRGSL